jgi:RHS repeat-associated protein
MQLRRRRFYQATASNICGTSGPSNITSTIFDLDPPSGLSAVWPLNGGQTTVTWGAVKDADAYGIWWSDTSPLEGGTFLPQGATEGNGNTSWIDPHNFGNGPKYVYIKAKNTAGFGSPSVIIEIIRGQKSRVIGAGVKPCLPYECSCAELPAGGTCGGSSEHDPVNLATGAESYRPNPDIVVYNPNGPAVVWQRNYHTSRALNAHGSPGLSLGWGHSYDVTVRSAGSAGTWGPLEVTYQNGGSETFTPQLDGSGQPTGVLMVPSGAPYFVRGVPGANAGEWDSITVTWKDQTEWRFTQFSQGLYALVRVTDRMGKGLNLAWNSSDRTLSQITDLTSGSVLLSFNYNGDGSLSSVVDIYGRQVVYTYDAPYTSGPGLLLSVSQVGSTGTTPPPHWTYSYYFDNGRLLRTITVPSPTGSGNSTATINYGDFGRVSSLVDANGNQRVVTYGTGSTQVAVKNALGATAMAWTQHYDSEVRGTGITDAANHSTLREFADTANPLKPTRLVDQNGKATVFAYDQFGNVLTVTTPRNVTTVYAYDHTPFALGRLTSVKEGTKPATTFTYFEPSGLLQSVTSPSPTGTGTVTTSLTYDTLGNVLTQTGPGNNAASQITTTFNYTTDGGYTQPAKTGQPLTATDNLGHATHMRYDAQGRVTSATDAIGNETDAAYNLVGQVTSVTYPATGQTGTGRARVENNYLYTGGPLTTVTLFDESNAQARQVTYGYGPEGEAASVAGSTEPVTYTYDALYRLKTLKDGNNNQTTYSYDGVGNVSSVQMPGGETIQFPSHDPSGRVLQRIDGNNVTTNYVYDDPENLLTDIQYPATPSLNVHFGYDTFGRRTSMTDSTGSHSYAYGDLNELKSATTAYTGVSPMTVSYSYYADGSRSQMATPAGLFTYSYDGARRMTALTNPSYETTQWTYFDNGWLRTQQLNVGVLTTYSYNGRGQLTRLLNELNGSTISDFTNFAYDGAGNRLSYASSVPGYSPASGALTYEYDAKDQLTREQSTRGTGFNHTFGYDAAGNPTSFAGASKTFNSNNQQTGAGFTHNANGNPTTYKGASLTFDPENRLTSYGSQMTAAYRGDGLRAWKESGGVRTYFLYDGSLPIMEVSPSSGGGGGEEDGPSDSASSSINTFGAAGLVSRSYQGFGPQGGVPTSYYSFDPQGGVSRVVSPAYSPIGVWPPLPPTVSAPQTYTAHGEALTGGTVPFGYGAQWGYFTDSESGLQLLTNRYYDPQAGRFLTRDPIGYRGGINLYSYVANNPVNAIDPLGHELLTPEQYTFPHHSIFPDPPKYPNPSDPQLVYRCGRPIQGSWSFAPGGHEYLCAGDVCGGVGPRLGIKWGDGLFGPVPSITTDSTAQPNLSDCFIVPNVSGQCVKDAINGPKPDYQLVPFEGENCWTWPSKAISKCRK